MADLAIKLPPAEFLDNGDAPMIVATEEPSPPPAPEPVPEPRPEPADVPADVFDRTPVVAPNGPTIADITKRDNLIRSLTTDRDALAAKLAEAEHHGLARLIAAHDQGLAALYLPQPLMKNHGGEIKRAVGKIKAIFERNGSAMLAVTDVSTSSSPSKINSAGEGKKAGVATI